MYRRTIILLSLALVFFVLQSSVKADLTDGLVGYWPLDGNGDDASGNGNHGTVNGSVTPVPDRFGNADSAMSFPGNTSAYIDVGQPPMLLIKGAMSVCAWVRAETVLQNGRIIAKQGPSSARSWGLNLESAGGFARFDIGVNPTDRFRADSDPLTFGPEEWFHLAGVFRPGESVDLYVNGELARSEATSLTEQWIENGLPVNIGRRPQPGTPWNGDIDEVRMYNRSLADEEVMSVMNQTGVTFTKARSPNPEDGATVMSTWVNLSWMPGDFAVSHDVYFGESFEDVDAGTAGTFLGNQTNATILLGFPGFPYPDGLVEGTTYYWRVDEVNPAEADSPWKGDIWSFTVPSKKAHNPNPPDNAMYVTLNPTLTWTSGIGAALHHVYIGDNLADVEAGTGDTYKGALTAASYKAGPLEKDKVYYWRVDEFDVSATNTGNVWSFRTIPDIPVGEPELMGWWKLDEGHSTTAYDWSGHGNDGLLQGDAGWTDGHDGAAVELGGSGNIYAETAQLPTGAFTMAFWFRPAESLNANDPRQDFMYWQNGSRPHITFNRSGDGEIGFWPNIGGDFDGPETTSRAWAAGRWYHITATFDGTDFNIYVNGVMEDTVSHPGVHSDASGLIIGARSGSQNYFTGDIDDVRLYSKALTEAEIGLAMRVDTLVAWNPNPGDGTSPYIKDALPLTWSAGQKAAQHEIYFGMDRDAVENADATDTTGIYRGSQVETSYTPSEGVEWGGGPYYWRVDQVNNDGTTTIGRIWSFSVADYITVDDFESYDDVDPAPGEPGINRIFDVWIDGFGTTNNGALVGNDFPPYAEQTVVHDGAQSMIYRFDNNNKTSEATLTLTDRKDWTEEGVTRLVIWFRGLSANSTDRMYVALNGNAVVYHPEADATQRGVWTWTEWFIDLQEFANQGVDLANVNSFTIGIGTKGSPAAGGQGTMYFDDIRLYR